LKFPEVPLWSNSARASLITKGNDRIDLGEWRSGTADASTLIDKDRDQRITEEEIDELASPIRSEVGDIAGGFAAVLVTRILLTFDKDKDGAASLDESTKANEIVFQKLDTDGNSEISEEEGLRFPTAFLLSWR